MSLAALVRTRERFMGIGQMVMMPLFFASSALYPLSIMPHWLRIVARVNPLTYEVHGMRQLMLGVSTGGTLWVDFVVVAGFLAVMAASRRGCIRARSCRDASRSPSVAIASPYDCQSAVVIPTSAGKIEKPVVCACSSRRAHVAGATCPRIPV